MVFGAARPLRGGSFRRSRPLAIGSHLDASAVKADLHAAVEVGSIRRDAARPQPLEGRWRGVAVVVVGTHRDDREARPDRVEERRRRGGPRPVVRDLEQIDPRQPSTDERRVDVLLHVAGEQEPLPARRPEQHDRGVVDGLSVVQWPVGNCAGVRPQHGESDRVELELFAAREVATWRPTLGERRLPRPIARPRSRQPRLVDRPDRVAREHHRQARDVVLMRMCQDHDVDAPVPRREPLVERLEQAVRIGAAVDHHPAAPVALDQDRVALADIEHRDVDGAVRLVRDRQAERDGRAGKRHPGQASRPSAAGLAAASLPRPSRNAGPRRAVSRTPEPVNRREPAGT
jgi:hypothetical protein